MKKNSFSSTLGFVAAAAGSAVGLGNIWKFPYEVGTYGGASFLLLYILFTALVGYPLLVAELAFGRKMQTSLYQVYQHAGGKKWGGLGVFIAICSFSIFSFYNVITGWTIGYLLEILFGDLLHTSDTAVFFTAFTKSIPKNVAYTGLSILPITLIIKEGIAAGIEKWSKILMPLFLILLLGLISYALTLDQAGKGLAFYLVPRLDAITPGAVFTALGQSFLSLSLGLGIMSTYGAYMRPTENIPRLAAAITGSDMLVSFLAGLFLFPMIFYHHIVPSEGSSLIFISLPLVFKALGPIVGPVVGGTFFLLFAFAALTSSMSLLEVLTAYVQACCRLTRKQAVWVVALSAYLLSIPNILSHGGSTFFTAFIRFRGISYSFFSFLSFIVIEIALPLSCLLFISFVVYQWKTKKLWLEIRQGSTYYKKSWLEKYIQGAIMYACPGLIGIVFLLKLLQVIGVGSDWV